MLYFIAGILTMSAISCVVMIFTYDEEKAILIMSGPIGWILFTISIIVRKIIKIYDANAYQALLFGPDGKAYHIKSNDADTMLYLEGWSFVNQSQDPVALAICYHAEQRKHEWNKRFCFHWGKNPNNFSINYRYCPRSFWKSYPPIPADKFAEAKKFKKKKEKTY